MTGIIDRFEDGFVIVELPEGMQSFALSACPPGLLEGQCVTIEGGTITGIDEAATAARAEKLRSRFERLKRHRREGS